MTCKEWLDAIARGDVPDVPRQKEQLASLRELGMIESMPYSGWRLTQRGGELRQMWNDTERH